MRILIINCLDMRTPKYQIELKDGSKWTLEAAIQAREWIERLAAILGLVNHVDDRKTMQILVTCASNNPDSAAKWPFDITQKNSSIRQENITVEQEYSDNHYEIKTKSDLSRTSFVEMCLVVFPIYQHSIRKGGFPVHAALIEAFEKGFLLIGRSNTGKTTSFNRLKEIWNPLSDDEALVVLDAENDYYAHPFPTWSEYIMEQATQKTYHIQNGVPLTSLFFIEKSSFDEIVPMQKHEVVIGLCDSAFAIIKRFLPLLDDRNKRMIRNNIFDNVCRMAEQVPGFNLKISLDGSFWKLVEKVINGKNVREDSSLHSH